MTASQRTGQSKATTNRAIARADALGDEALTKVANTSLDSGVELDALARAEIADARGRYVQPSANLQNVSQSNAPRTVTA